MNDTLQLHRIHACGHVRHVELHDVLPSTNDLALRRAGDEAVPLPALFIAVEQTDGRGRGTNRWWSSRGGLTFSLLRDAGRLRLDGHLWPRMSLAAAVAVCDVIGRIAPELACGIRWPNDVYVEDHKVAGLLVELPSVAAGASRRVVIGVGLNVNNSLLTAPVEVRRVGTSLADATGRTFDLTGVLVNVLDRLAHRAGQLAAGNVELAGRWQSLCLLRGRRIEIQTGPSRAEGLCLGVQSDGALLLETSHGTKRCFAGVLTSVQ